MLLIFALRILLLLLLYGFLFLLAYLVWRDLQTRSTAAPERQGAPATASGAGRAVTGPRLVVVDSGERGLPIGRAYPLATVTTIGRDLTNDIIIADSFASGQHARIELRGDRFWLEDLGSRNGTLFNGAALPAHNPVPLDPGDLISIGKTQFKVG